jgi:hypothetical protein
MCPIQINKNHNNKSDMIQEEIRMRILVISFGSELSVNSSAVEKLKRLEHAGL